MAATVAASPSTPSKIQADVLLISPLRAPQSTPESARKRKITPSAEQSSPKRSVLIAPPGTISSTQRDLNALTYPNPLYLPFLSGEVTIDARWSLNSQCLQPESHHDGSGKPSPISNPLLQSPVLPARHIALPFDLRTEKGAWSEDDNFKLLSTLFPTTFGVGYDDFFLYFHLTTFPPKPWPKTVAGVPCFFTQDMAKAPHPLPFGRIFSMRNPRIAEDIKGRDVSDWEPLFLIIKDYFEKIEVSITEVFYWGNYFTVVLERRDTDLSQLPTTVAKLRVSYFFEDQMGRPTIPQARRTKEPEPSSPDNSEYRDLQPGIRLASGYNPANPGEYFETTAGVLVEDNLGNKYMTVASHGFPPGHGSFVYHPSPGTGRQIGELIMEVAHTDVALVKLNKDEAFTNMAFESDILPMPTQFKKFDIAKDVQKGEFVYLDSPDTGLIDGTYIGNARRRVPNDDPSQPEQEWIFVKWVYMGQDSGENLPDGMCGSAIWKEDGSVLGFFHYAPKKGVMVDYCCSVAADELIKEGYSVVTANP